MMKRYPLLILMIVLIVSQSANAMTCSSLNDKIISNQKLAIIDIRSTEQYQKSHIPGAINVPARLCPHKRLPRFGQVVVYGDGLNETILKQAVYVLNQKDGIRAVALKGGFSQWKASNYSITENTGMLREELPYITFQDFEKMVKTQSGILLLDIRSQKDRSRSISDLIHRYPNLRVMSSPFKKDRQRLKSSQDLFVLIDSCDGASEKMAHQMKSAGIKHFVILTGGEQSFLFPKSQNQ